MVRFPVRALRALRSGRTVLSVPAVACRTPIPALALAIALVSWMPAAGHAQQGGGAGRDTTRLSPQHICPIEPQATTTSSDTTRKSARSTASGDVSTQDECPGEDFYAPSVSISPGHGTYTSSSLAVTITWCDHETTLDQYSRYIALNGVNVTGNFSYSSSSGCYSAATSGGTITLSPGDNTFYAEIADAAGNVGYNSRTYTYDPNTYGVSVTAQTSSVIVPPASANAALFTLKNTGSGYDSYVLTASCASGASYGGCVTSADTLGLAGGASTTISVYYQAVTTAGSTGSVTLTAARTASSSTTSSARTDVTVGSASAPVVVVDTVNPGDAFDRAQCLTINVGPGAAYECGDLRLVHGLPAVKSLNRPRAPTLLYSSQHAHPVPLVAANVTMAGSAIASTVEARVLVGGKRVGSASWSGSDWGSLGAVRRIVVPVDSALAGGIHDYTFEVTFVSSTGTRTPYTATGRLAVVDRSTSPFGAGWWLAGLERLTPSTMVWVGGDGSVRQYRSAGTNVWAAAGLDHPDTLKWDGSHYVRHLPAGVRVKFNGAGQHVQTVNRLGHITTFEYDGAGRLSRIVVPTPGSGSSSTTSTSTASVSSGDDAGTADAGAATAPRGPARGSSGSDAAALIPPCDVDCEEDLYPPYVSFTPSGGTYTSDRLTVTIAWCDAETGLQSNSRYITLNGADVTYSFDYVTGSSYGCAEYAESRGTITLQAGSNTLYAEIADWSWNYGYGQASYTYEKPAIVLAYRFTYDASGKLQYVYAPGTSGERVTTLTVSGGSVQSIRDPDGTTVSFGYQTGSAETHRIYSRTDRRGKVTTFAYDAGKRLTRSTRNPGGGAASVVLNVIPAETRGLPGTTSGAAQVLSNVFARIDGPRSDVADVTQVWVNRFGAPAKVQDAVGGQTTIAYGDVRWPALATRVQHPNGRTIVSAYTNRGAAVHSTDLSWVQNGRAATTRFEWDAKWDAVTLIRTPTGLTTRFAYDGTTGNRIWQEDGRGSSSRVHFRYYTDSRTYGLLRAIEIPGGLRDSVVYDGSTALGNLSATRAASGAWTYFANDAIGRPTIVRKPVDAAGTVFQSDTLTYDVNDQVTRSVNYGPAFGSQAAQKVVVRTFYNAEGQTDSLHRWSEPDATGVGVIRTRWYYDDIGRVVAELSPDGKPDSSFYDPAGNVVRQRTRRGHSLTMVYDALGRLTKRRIPEVSYCSRNEGLPARRSDLNYNGNNPAYPRYPNNGCSGITIPADSAVFTYDAVGNMLTADNREAKVQRSYHPNGLLRTDTLRIRTVAELAAGGSFGLHVYGLEYLYDLDGRRTDLRHPAQLRAGTLRDRTSYAYHAQMGALERVTDLTGTVFTYGFDAAGRVTSLTLPGGISESYGYDAGGRLASHLVRNQSTSTYKWSEAYLRYTDFRYDARDKVTRTANIYGTRDTLSTSYSALGHLTDSWFRSRGKDYYGNTVVYTVTEDYEYDALANFRQSSTTTRQDYPSGYSTSTRGRGQGYVTGVGRLAYEENAVQRDTFHYDLAGNTEFTTQAWIALVSDAAYSDRASYYGADGTLRAADYRTLSRPDQIFGFFRTAFEEYRYDALGRRVLVRARRWCENDPDYFNGECRIGKIKRTIWDGGQELYEIQMPGQDGSTLLENDTSKVVLPSDSYDTHKIDPNPFFGRVAYTHGGSLDQPLSVIRLGYGDLIDESNIERPHRALAPFAIMPLWASSGQADNGVFSDGGVRRCETSGGVTRCVYIQWPAFFYAYARQGLRRSAWHGSLVEDKKDGAGTFYRRNRQYDPATGRFTQEDPIGLAGGLNLYGFAGGDPVNYSDPFGLCENERGEWRRCEVRWSSEASDTTITQEMRDAAQQLADEADVDLTLSSGRRAQGNNCAGSRHNCGKAIDISAINGVDIGQETVVNPAAAHLVERVQETAMGMAAVRENYGPAGLFRSDASGQPQRQRPTSTRILMNLQLQHMNHIHISIH